MLKAAARLGRQRGNRIGGSFGAFWIAVVCSDFADGEFRTTVPLMALAATRSAFAVSAVSVAARLPWILLTLPAGVVVDRHRPASVMRVASAVRLPLAACAVVLAAVGALSVAGLAAIAFAVSAAGTFADVSAQALLPTLVSGEKLRSANQRLQSAQRLGSQLAGPALGGYAAARGSGWGPGAATVLYLVVFLALTHLSAPVRDRQATAGLVRGQSPAEPAPVTGGRADRGPARAALAELREGAAYFRGRSDLFRLAALSALGNLSFSMCATILPIWAVAPGPLGLSGGYYGLLLGSLAAGGTAASVFARPLLERLGDPVVLRWSTPVIGLSLLAIALPSAPVAAVALVIMGAVFMLWSLTVVSYRQSTIPREVFGRVVAVSRWVTWGVLPFGSLLAGLIGGLAGTEWVFIVAGALPLAGAALLAFRGLVLVGQQVPRKGAHG